MELDREGEREREARVRREGETTGNQADVVQFTSRLRDWLSYGRGCICEDIYRRSRVKGHHGDRSPCKVHGAGTSVEKQIESRSSCSQAEARKLDFSVPRADLFYDVLTSIAAHKIRGALTVLPSVSVARSTVFT